MCATIAITMTEAQQAAANASLWRLSDLEQLPWKSMSHFCGDLNKADYAA